MHDLWLCHMAMHGHWCGAAGKHLFNMLHTALWTSVGSNAHYVAAMLFLL
jgi:hypothetical protein